MCKVRKVADDIMNGYLNNVYNLNNVSMNTIYELRHCTMNGRVRKVYTSPYATPLPMRSSLFQRKLKLRINSSNLTVIA